jgi:hypothetical protein
LFCYCRSQVLQLCHIFKGSVSYLYAIILFCSKYNTSVSKQSESQCYKEPLDSFTRPQEVYKPLLVCNFASRRSILKYNS